MTAPPPPPRLAPADRRYVLLADGPDGLLDAKTAIGVLRYRPASAVAVVDRRHAGRRAREVVDVAHDAPIVASIAEALPFAPNSALVGITSPGGRLPASCRADLRAAIEAGLHLVNGLHDFVGEDAELAAAAAARGLDVWDLRRPPAGLPVGRGAALRARPLIVHTIGTDCSVGKMTASLELVAALERAGVRAAFVPTGQTGMAIAGWGIAVDAVVADFISGATERMVLEAAEGADVLVVEGQGTLLHPAFSGVTLGLLHGCMPHAVVMCHEAGLGALKREFGVAIPPLADVVAMYRAAMAPFRADLAWVGTALNCRGLTDAATEAACGAIERETGRACVDPVKMGAARLAAEVAAEVAALLAGRGARR